MTPGLTHFLLILALVFGFCPSQGQSQTRPAYPVEGQSPDHPLTTAIGEEEMQEIKGLQYQYKTQQEWRDAVREKLQPLADEGDPVAAYLLARLVYDHFMSGTTADEKTLAMKFYTMAADAGYVKAIYFMNEVYAHGSVSQPLDYEKAWQALQKTIEYGDDNYKAKAYTDLAYIYFPRDDSFNLEKYPWVNPSADSTIYFLELALNYDPEDDRVKDFLGGMYSSTGSYEDAAERYLASDNEQMHLKVAKWLLEGENLPQDRTRALEMIRKCAVKVRKNNPPNGEGYMGGVNPIYWLNEMYHCQKSITKEEIGEFDMGYWICN